MHASQSPVSLSARLGKAFSPDLEALLLACLEKDPEDRPASALELRDALVGCADAAGWPRARADEWWREHGDLIARIHDESQGQGAMQSIAVDLARR